MAEQTGEPPELLTSGVKDYAQELTRDYLKKWQRLKMAAQAIGLTNIHKENERSRIQRDRHVDWLYRQTGYQPDAPVTKMEAQARAAKPQKRGTSNMAVAGVDEDGFNLGDITNHYHTVQPPPSNDGNKLAGWVPLIAILSALAGGGIAYMLADRDTDTDTQYEIRLADPDEVQSGYFTLD